VQLALQYLATPWQLCVLLSLPAQVPLSARLDAEQEVRVAMLLLCELEVLLALQYLALAEATR
jgi:hypothetical protein